MSQAEPGLRTASVEIGTALVLAGLGSAAVWDSARLGIGWSADGPQSGTFPFWIGVALIGASLGTLVGVLRRAEDGVFVTWAQGKLVLSVLLPTIVYVAAIPFTGLYLASAVLVGWFMLQLGGFPLWKGAAAGLATAVVAFVVFEIWFLVALPKGPIETWLGY